MATVHRWTGLEAKLLREALRLSLRDFAARLGVGIRTVNKWESRLADIVPLPHMQEILDTALDRASTATKERFDTAINIYSGNREIAPTTEQSNHTVPQFWQTVAATALGFEQGDVDLEKFDALISGADGDGSQRHLDTTDLAVLEQVTDVFRRWDLAHGGGLPRAAATAQLRALLRLREAKMRPAVRSRLDMITADLAMLTAWCSYDVEQHDQARHLWMVALKICQYTDHPRAGDLAVDVLLDMAHQSLHRSRPREALRLVGLGLAVENYSPGSVSDLTRSYLSSVQSWSYAALGERVSCERALGRAEEHFTAVDPATAPPWAAHVDSAEFAAQQGHAWYLLSATDAGAADRAVALLAASTNAQSDEYARTRAVNLAGLAGSYARTGEVASAVQLGFRALKEIDRTSSRRAYQRLRMLDDCLAAHQTSDVSDLRQHIQTACATA